MADKMAEITSINLESGNLNLDDEELQITSYTGYNKKNSMFLGGQLKNWYKKEVTLPSYMAGKVIQKWNDSIIWQNNGIIYKDDIAIGSFDKNYYTNENVTDKWNDISGSSDKWMIRGDILSIKMTDKVYDIVLSGLYSFNITYESSVLWITLFNRDSYLTVYFQNGTFLQDSSKIVYGSQVVAIPTVTGDRKTYDSICITGDTPTVHNYYANNTLYTFTHSEIIESVKSEAVEGETKYTTKVQSGWCRGRKVPTTAMFGEHRVYILYYNYEQTGISVNNSTVVSNIDSVVTVNGNKVYYKDSERILRCLEIKTSEDLQCSHIIKDRYITINTTSYNNTIDLLTNSTFCRSDDYNDRVIINTTKTDKMYFVVTGWNEQVETKKYVNFSSVYPARLQYGKVISSIKNYCEEDLPHDINIYIGDQEGLIVPVYNSSYNLSLSQYKTNFDLTDSYYPMNDYPLMNTSVLSTFTDIYLNYALINEGGYSFVTQIDQYQNMIFGYYPSTYITLDNLFVIQGAIYGINNQFIVNIVIQDMIVTGVNTVCNKSDMQFIGATPKSALFYSPMDKSIYLFTGDQSMTKIYDCNRITNIYSFYNNPATGFILISTNDGILGIYNDQIYKLNDTKSNFIYYTDNSYIIDNIAYTPYKKEDYERLPIILETKFYGVGNEVKSLNDCAYIRLYSENDESNGKVKVWCETLNEKTQKSEEKTFLIDKSMFDKSTHSLYLRYQPKLQAATGYRLHIESDFSICTLSMSHKVETIQNAKYNI